MPAANESPTIEALSALVQLGASDTLLGLAVRELVSGHRIGAAVVAGAPVGMTMASSAPRSGAASVPAAGPAAPAARQEPAALAPPQSPGSSPAGASTQARKAPKPAKPEILVFKNKAGVRSSISIAATDWVELVAAFGGDEDALRTKAREVAKGAPEGGNRSKWTRDQLLVAARQAA